MQQYSLVLYKNRAAYVTQLGIKLEIVTIDGKRLKVRHKDVTFLAQMFAKNKKTTQ